MNDRAARLVVIGRVAGVYGVRGWIKVHSFTEPPEAILEHPSWRLWTGSEWRPAELMEGRRHGKLVLAHLASCDDRDVARTMVGAELAVLRTELPDPGPGGFYWADLVGLTVRTVAGVELGVVDRLLETGANDVLVVNGEKERLIPYVRGDVVTGVDLERGVMTVDWDPEF